MAAISHQRLGKGTHLFVIYSISQTSRWLISTGRNSDLEEGDRSERREIKRRGKRRACGPAADNMPVSCVGCALSSDPGRPTQAQPACLMRNVFVFFFF